MGMSASASIAWGVDLGGPEEDEMPEGLEELMQNDYELTGVLGFTEPAPWYGPTYQDLPQKEKKALVDAWIARKEAAIPVEVRYYGHYADSGYVLVVNCTYASVNWRCGEVNMDPLETSATPAELEAVNKVLDAIGFKGDRTVKLLMWAYYG